MGRGVSVPSGAQWTVYFNLEDPLDEDGNTIPFEQQDWDFMLEDTQEHIISKFPSFIRCNRWLDREDHAILENELGCLVLCEYCGVCSLSYVSESEDFPVKAWYFGYLMYPEIKKTYGQLEKLGTFSNGEAVFQQAIVETTPVVFRKLKKDPQKGEVIALFPEERELCGLCSSYMHVGQHGSADFIGIIKNSTPAKPDEYAPLMKELESAIYGYKLDVRSPTAFMGT